MAINQLNPTGFSYSELLAGYEKAYKTQADITITNYDNDSAPQVTAGSIFACNGTHFENTALATPTGYSGISNSTTFYLYYDESGGVFIYSSTAPTWSDALQGWYNGNDRAFFSMYKDSGGTLYQYKYKIIDDKSILDGYSIRETYLHGTYTFAQIFDKLNLFVPNVGDIIKCNGGVGGTNVLLAASYIEKQASDNIRIYGAYIDHTTGTSSIVYQDIPELSAFTTDVSISWGRI